MKNGYHSRAYHRHFEDYEEVVEPGKNPKKKKIRRIYTGVYYIPQMTRAQYIRQKALYGFLYALALALFIACAAVSPGGDEPWYVVIPIAVSFLTFLALLRYLIQYLTAKRKLTVGEYNEGPVSMRRSALVCAACVATAAIIKAVAAVFGPAEARGMEAASAGGLLLSAAAVFLLWRLEGRVVYAKEQAGAPN